MVPATSKPSPLRRINVASKVSTPRSYTTPPGPRRAPRRERGRSTPPRRPAPPACSVPAAQPGAPSPPVGGSR
jgi:hypothetical protein